MKFLIKQDPKGTYVTATGSNVSVITTTAGKDYTDEAAFIAAYKLVLKADYIVRQTAIAKFQKEFETSINKGYSDPTLNVTIAITDADRIQFSALETHLTLKAAPDDMPITIKDIAGGLHNITRAQYHTLIINAGDYYLTLWTTLQQNIASTATLTASTTA